MIAKLRRPVALLLVLLTLFSLVPFGFADEFPTIQSESGVDPPTGETAPIEEGAATEPPAETTEPLTDAPTEAPTEAAVEEATQPPAEGSPEETIPEDAALEDQLPDDLDADDRILDADTYASTQNSIMLFDYADNGDYTTRLNYQVSCTYQPNGSGMAIGNNPFSFAVPYKDDQTVFLDMGLPMRMSRCTALSPGGTTGPAPPAILLTGM